MNLASDRYQCHKRLHHLPLPSRQLHHLWKLKTSKRSNGVKALSRSNLPQPHRLDRDKSYRFGISSVVLPLHSDILTTLSIRFSSELIESGIRRIQPKPLQINQRLPKPSIRHKKRWHLQKPHTSLNRSLQMIFAKPK